MYRRHCCEWKACTQNTLTQPFFWGVNMDEKCFKNHSTFNPDRFLDNEGKIKIKYHHLSFGKGKEHVLEKV
uniref:Uncharacterized protein n=1 Tax=Strongyloides venezuelensis TaxID=75913 RepID=A0A0K0EZ44_STRVS